VSSSGGAVPHSLGAFMHVAIHKNLQVACPPWRCNFLPAFRLGGFAR
jgi:hypothetical protein